MTRISLLYIFLLCSNALAAQDKSNRGKEFWLGYGHTYTFEIPDGLNGLNSQNLKLYISAEETATVTVSVNGTSWSRTVNIPANSVDFSIDLPKSGPEDCRLLDEGLSQRGVHIISDVPVVVYAHEFNTQMSGATMLMPVETYGYSYYSVNYTQSPFGFDAYSWFFVVASEDNTRLQITPANDTKKGWLAGETYTVNLNKGEVYNVFGKVINEIGNDMTGSKVVSISGDDGKCHPVALFSGSSIVRFCDGDGGEVIKQQVFPASAWGTRYLTWHMLVNAAGNITTPFPNFYRIIVKDPGTVVKRNGVVLTGLVKNLYYEYTSTDGDYIEADKPILMAQFSPNQNKCVGNSQNSLGDPEMFFLTPMEQGMKKVTFYSTKNSVITVNYASAIVHKDGIASFTVDGVPLTAANYITHPYNSDYRVVVKRLLGAAAQHSMKSDSAFSSQIYGIGNFESYGYIGGTLVNNLNAIGAIENVYNITGKPSIYTCPKSPVKLSVQLAYKATAINWKLSQVAGISPNTDVTVSDPVAADSTLINGRKYYIYILDGAYVFDHTDTFYVPVTYTSPDIDHCTQTEEATIEVIVKPGPVADFTADYHGCIKDTAHFINATIPYNYPLYKYVWGYEDNTTDTAFKSEKKFDVGGEHPVKYTVIAEDGCFGDTTKPINTYFNPVATFTYERDVCLGDSVRFIDQSTPAGITNREWNFGDGNNTTKTNELPFYHAYIAIGKYPVDLSVTSSEGCKSETFKLEVSVNEKPKTSFTVKGKPCVDSSYTLASNSSFAGTLTQWYWDLGNGQTFTNSNGNPFTKVYGFASNPFTIKHVVSDGAGCVSDTFSSGHVAVNANPTADFAIEGGPFCPGANVMFTSASADPLLSWFWEFDNTTSTKAPPVWHQYSYSGDYTVRLTVSSAGVCFSKPVSKPLTIQKAPQKVDAGPNLIINEGASMTLRASINNPQQYHYHWTPGIYLDNSTFLNPLVTPLETTKYTITASGDGGACPVSDTVRITVLKKLSIPNAFSPNDDGINDTWYIKNLENYQTAIVEIFDRYGRRVYQSTGYNKPWDGRTSNGSALPVGVYYFIITPNGNNYNKITGSVTLIR